MPGRIDISRRPPTASEWYKLVKNEQGGEVRVVREGAKKFLTVEHGGPISWAKGLVVGAERLATERREARELLKAQLGTLIPDGGPNGDAIVRQCLGDSGALSPGKVLATLLRNERIKDMDELKEFSRLDRVGRETALAGLSPANSPRVQELFVEHVRLISADFDVRGARNLGDGTTGIGWHWKHAWTSADQPMLRQMLDKYGEDLFLLDARAIAAPVLGLKWPHAFDVMTRMRQANLIDDIFRFHSDDINYFMADAKHMQESSGDLNEHARGVFEHVAALCREAYGLAENEPPLRFFMKDFGDRKIEALGFHGPERGASRSGLMSFFREETRERVVNLNVHPSAMALGILEIIDTISHEYTHAYQHALAAKTEWDNDAERDAAEAMRFNFKFYLSAKAHSDRTYRKQPVERHAFAVGKLVRRSIREMLWNEYLDQQATERRRGGDMSTRDIYRETYEPDATSRG